MFDALKFAFEILIVGVLALPWIAVLYRMFPASPAQNVRLRRSSTSLRSGISPASSSQTVLFDLSFVPKGAQDFVAVALVIGVGYLLGSAVSRFSADFFNDEMFRWFVTQDQIRGSVYYSEFCGPGELPQVEYQYLSQPIHLPPVNICPKSLPAHYSRLNRNDADPFDDRVEEVFRLEESALLHEGLDKVDRLKQYFDQITILRGAALNAVILFLLALFGCCGQLKERWPKKRLVAWFGFVPPSIVAGLTIASLIKHWSTTDIYQDPPLAETTLLLLAAVGLHAAWKPQRNVPYEKICIIAVVAMVMSIGGWWWTEKTYDLQVIHSLPDIKVKTVLPTHAQPPD